MERVRRYMILNAGLDWSLAMALAKVQSPLTMNADIARHPQWYDRLGSVCESDVTFLWEILAALILGCLSAIAALVHDYQIPVGFLLIDDGYAQTTPIERLTSFEPDPRKFPRGLNTFVEDVRRRFGVKNFGVWHALQGYWNGYPLRNVKSRPNVWLVEGSDVERFYNDLYADLKSQGIDFFKIDNQASFDLYLNEPFYNKQPLWRLYQDAILRVAYPACIWCMAQSPYITYYTYSCAIPMLGSTQTIGGPTLAGGFPQIPQTPQPFPVSRSSDDYYPEKIDLQAGHVLTNCMNNIWTSAFGNFLADWDMFQSDIAFGAYQAAARSLNNGPIYISDEPAGTDAAVVRPLFVGAVPAPASRGSTSNNSSSSLDGSGDHRVLRPLFPALPSNDNFFCDARDVHRALKLCNLNFVHSNLPGGDASVYVAGFFNARTEIVVDNISCHCIVQAVGWRLNSVREIGDHQGFDSRLATTVRYAAFSFNHRQVRVVDAQEPIVVFLRPADFEILSFSQVVELTSEKTSESIDVDANRVPRTADVSCLGLVDKYNGSVAIRSVDVTPTADGKAVLRYSVTLWGRGVTGFLVTRTDCGSTKRCGSSVRLEDDLTSWLRVTMDGEMVSQERLGSEDDMTLLVDARVEGREAVGDVCIVLEMIEQ
ncbi:hypothetical protein HDU93_002979 [Gonapodya sp. JEL0774]|nr:hypothetical protein HDU93_002979 [Gonapodya sp. JEL0774]